MRSHESRSASRLALRALGAGGLVSALGVLGAGCLTRPVERGEPSLKTNFITQFRQAAVDKVDLLFAIDNSASMGDKQNILAQAVPDLMQRLVQPNCVDDKGNAIVNGGTPVTVQADGTCTQGKPEFPPVHDMHIGIVTSSLGGRGSDACPASGMNPVVTSLNAHGDDQGHLINRAGDTEAPVSDADQGNGSEFLAWFPSPGGKNAGHTPPAKAVTDATTLNTDFGQLVSGVHQYGCGFEAQLESWYHFLIQPDPYGSLVKGNNGYVSLQGVDNVILQQRADFLRPDSLVAIIQLTDENDSTVDPLALGGQGWAYENTTFPGSTTGSAARGTSQCAQNPTDPKCTSCGFCCRDATQGCTVGTPADICNDPNCSDANKGYYQSADDQLNERFFHMKQRFGYDPQFPVSRYYNALTSGQVPNRDGEHPATSNGVSSNYVGNNNCTNPLFAMNLPKSGDASKPDAMCKLTPGPRTPDLVYYAAITGVPWQLLLQTPASPFTGPFKDALDDNAWAALIGKDPLNYDFSGADPHMIESLTANRGIPANDPIVLHDYTTGGADLEYACTFPLPDAPRDCNSLQNKFACDCTSATNDSPLCDTTTKTNQLRGKAYPCIRELSLVRQMKDQGIVASLCPRTDTSGALLPQSDADYGYRPAVRAIINRLKASLANTCVPQKLVPDQSGQVPCLILLSLAGTSANDLSVCAQRGFTKPDATVLAKFLQTTHDQWVAHGSAGVDPSTLATCQLNQKVVPAGATCAGDSTPEWCYVVNANGQLPAGTCGQSVIFTQAGNPTGATISLQCIEANTVGDAGAVSTGGE